MRVSKSNKQAILEWTIVAGSVITATVVAEKVGLDDKWENALVYTVITFSVVIAVLRSAWGSAGFWWKLAGIFVLHVIIMTSILQILSPESQGFHGIPMIIAGTAEIFLIASISLRGVRSSNKRSSPDDTTRT
jgi:hypothetical protein